MDQGQTAFILISAALVLLMTPALAFFYGGLVKTKSVVSMMMLSFGSLALEFYNSNELLNEFPR